MFILFLTTPAFSLVMFPASLYLHKAYTDWCVEFYRLFFIAAWQLLIRHICEQEASRPKGFMNFYGFKHNIFMGIFSCGKGSFSPQGFSFLPRWPQIFVGISESELFRACFGVFLTQYKTEHRKNFISSQVNNNWHMSCTNELYAIYCPESLVVHVHEIRSMVNYIV